MVKSHLHYWDNMSLLRKESKSKTVTSLSPFFLLRNLYEISYTLRVCLYLVMITTISVISVVILWILGILANETGFIFILFYSALLWGLGLGISPRILKAIRTLRELDDRYLEYAYINVFELTPSITNDVIEDVIQKVAVIYPRVDAAIKKKPTRIERNANVPGKNSQHEFDVKINLPDDEAIFVRYFKESREVNSDDLKKLSFDVQDVMKKEKNAIIDIIGISEVGFSEDAMDYISNKDNWFEDTDGYWTSMTLLEKAQLGYRLAWLQYGAYSTQV